jgi:hypothetical protein
MDGFKSLPKMACFKVGGSVKKEKEMCGGGAMRRGGSVEKEDEAQDKKMIKKAFKQHDEAEHDKEPTEIKLRKGGRAKKEGSVRKYKVGGSVENVYEAKKSSGDKDNIKMTKDIKPGKADAKSGAKEMPNKYQTGGKVKAKMNTGGDAATALLDAKIAASEAARKQRRQQGMQKNLSPDQQNQLNAQQAQATQQYGGQPATPTPPTDQMGMSTGMPAQKRGGRAGKKGC